jgi:hypothetical protein
MSSSMLLDSALINPELISQNIDGHPLEVTLDEFLHPGCFKSPADPCRRSRYPAAQRSSYPPPGPWDSCLLHPTSFRPADRADEVGDLTGQVVGRRPAQL